MYSTPYSAPPPYYSHYDSPQTAAYYSPRYSPQYSTPTSKGHARRATEDVKYTSYSKAYATPEPVTPRRTSSQRKPEYVSGHDRTRSKPTTSRRYVVRPATSDGANAYHTRVSEEYPSKPQHYVPYNDVYADYNKDEYLSAYERKYRYSPPPQQQQPQPPPYSRYQSHNTYRDPYADHYAYYDQNAYDESPSHHARPRRSSNAPRPSTRSPPKPKPTRPPPAQATDADARRAGIPAGYSFKNWDPTEEPILLLGSVFDANSLGKWIYDWTVACHGPSTPISEVAGDLWLLLIQLAGKIKRAEDRLPRVRRESNRDLIDEYLDGGERLWQRFNKLLKICETYMLRAAKREQVDGRKKVVIGKNSGCEFVDCIFGRDRELARTEKIMTGIRLWSMRFDANCEEVLRDPAA